MNRRQRSRGQALVEFALVFPIFVLLFFGLIDLGRYVFVANSANQAAREAARANAVMGWATTCPADATREACVRRVVGTFLQGAAAPPAGTNWTYQCRTTTGGVRAGGLTACRNGDTMDIAFRVTTFQLFTPVVAQLVPNVTITGSSRVAFNN